jgi:hypothetical protein
MQIIRNAGVVINSGGYNQLQVQRAAVTRRAPVMYSGGALYGLGAAEDEMAVWRREARDATDAQLNEYLRKVKDGWLTEQGAPKYSDAQLSEIKTIIIAEQNRRQWMKVGLLAIVGGAALWYASKKGWF